MATYKWHKTMTGVPYPHNLRGPGPRRKTFSLQQRKTGGEEKKLMIPIYVLENRGMRSDRKKEDRPRGVRQPVVSGASMQESSQTKIRGNGKKKTRGYQEMRGKERNRSKQNREIKRGQRKADTTETFIQLLFYQD